ncbi:hypothetical protein MNBD_GAMMA10-551 [hydrothermal vent metagenome]|uniref:Uncharacterized protein n=1 Tax=hydrothermal vent metagenome TaxID=652676 RepID=A0A3B0XYU3_9ZZZZ
MVTSIMNKLVFSFISYCLFTSVAYAYDDSTQLILERAGRLIGSSYQTSNPDKKLYGLRPEYSPARPSEAIHDDLVVTVKTLHSLQENSDTTVEFKGYKQYELWLKRVRDDFRARNNLEVRTMGICIDGCCNFPLDGGISHNTLYLEQVCFVIKNKKPFLKSITLLDGD